MGVGKDVGKRMNDKMIDKKMIDKIKDKDMIEPPVKGELKEGLKIEELTTKELVKSIFNAYNLIGDKRDEAVEELKKKMLSDSKSMINVVKYLIKKYLNDANDIERAMILIILSNFFSLSIDFISDLIEKLRNGGKFTKNDEEYIVNRFIRFSQR